MRTKEYDDEVLHTACEQKNIEKNRKTFIATVCQYNTSNFSMYTKSISISKRLYIKTRGPNCKL